MTHNICFILLAVDKENNNDPLKIWGLYLFVLAFSGECVNQLGSEVKSIPERSAGWFKTLDVWHRLMLCDIKKYFFIDMKFGINQAISQTITQLSCIQLETPSSRLWNFWWIKTYTTFNALYAILHMVIPAKYTTKDMRGNWTMVFIEFTTKFQPLMSSCCKEQGEVSILHPTCNHIFQKSRNRKIYEEYHRQMVWYDIC